MDPLVLTLLWLTVVALVVIGLAGAVVPVLPGVPLVFCGLWLAAWIDDYTRVGTWTLVALAVLVLISIIVDMLASAMGAKRVGASSKAIWGAILGSIVGIFFGLPGILLGPFIGAVLGEMSARSSMRKATDVGIATWMGLLFGTLAKLALSLAMVAIFVASYFL